MAEKVAFGRLKPVSTYVLGSMAQRDATKMRHEETKLKCSRH